MTAVIDATIPSQSRALIAYVVAEDGTILPVYQPATRPAVRLSPDQPEQIATIADEEATWEDAAWY